MEVVFLIGNGFDLNLGLKTKYIDFINWLNNLEPNSNKAVNKLQSSIKDYCNTRGTKDETRINWSDAEIAFGQFTDEFKGDSNGDEEIDECHTFICEKLSEYLQIEEKKAPIFRIIKDKSIMEEAGKAFANYSVGLLPVDKSKVDRAFSRVDGGLNIQIIDFNYTSIIDQIFEEVKKQSLLGTRVVMNTRYPNTLKSIIHVHGYLNHGLVFGVDNESQLSIEVFNNEEPERKRALIKECVNQDMGEAVDEKVTNAIDASNLLYVYGMSLGQTDLRWWKRIIRKMKADQGCILIIHKIDVPSIGLKPAPYKKYCRVNKEIFLKNESDLDENQKESIRNRIYYTNTNIFSMLENAINIIDV